VKRLFDAVVAGDEDAGKSTLPGVSTPSGPDVTQMSIGVNHRGVATTRSLPAGERRDPPESTYSAFIPHRNRGSDEP
jgi:hypothetical protein